jgi:hypothetical protein
MFLSIPKGTNEMKLKTQAGEWVNKIEQPARQQKHFWQDGA